MENEKTCQKRKCFIAEFPFLDNFRLLAEVDRQTGEQKLIVMYVDSRGRLINVASSGCIDTVVAIPKSVKSIKLSPKDRFISFKSWLAGITEAGLNGFFIQQQIEDLARSTVPISAFLIKFIAKYNFDFVLRYLLTIKRKCTIKGKPHIPSLLANLLFIKEILRLCD